MERNKKLSHHEVLFNTNGIEVRGLQDAANMFSDYLAGVSHSIVSAGIDLSIILFLYFFLILIKKKSKMKCFLHNYVQLFHTQYDR